MISYLKIFSVFGSVRFMVFMSYAKLISIFNEHASNTIRNEENTQQKNNITWVQTQSSNRNWVSFIFICCFSVCWLSFIVFVVVVVCMSISHAHVSSIYLHTQPTNQPAKQPANSLWPKQIFSCYVRFVRSFFFLCSNAIFAIYTTTDF